MAGFQVLTEAIIAYVFEEGQPHQRELIRLVDSLSDEDKWFFRMASLNFGKKKVQNQLQAADIVAYESMKEIVRKVNPLNERRARLSGLNLASNPARNKWFYCEEYAFLNAIKNAVMRAKAYPEPKKKAKSAER